MPRRPRIHLDGVPIHIVQRGHNREPCFFGEDDYNSYLHWLGEALGEAECKLHAYVLMTNHVHLLLTPKKAEAVQKLIISLGRRYVQYIFARARCGDCGHDFLVAFSCKGRGVCPSCNARRMAETAAHLTDHVFPRLPVRQWVLSVPKRLREMARCWAWCCASFCGSSRKHLQR